MSTTTTRLLQRRKHVVQDSKADRRIEGVVVVPAALLVTLRAGSRAAGHKRAAAPPAALTFRGVFAGAIGECSVVLDAQVGDPLRRVRLDLLVGPDGLDGGGQVVACPMEFDDWVLPAGVQE
jgi:hypothetical protein